MNPGRRRVLLAAAAVLATGTGIHAWLSRDVLHFLDGNTAPFVALFPPPPARGSPQERAELDTLLALQRARTAQDVERAQADRKTRIGRFAGALGLEPAVLDGMDAVVSLAEDVEDDARLYVRDAKQHFRRLRPREIEVAIKPCIGDVAADLSYPSGHSTWGYLMGYLLADLAPERGEALRARAAEFARQRMVCGVHFPSDVEAGQQGAQWLIAQMRRNPDFIAARERAREQLRAALPAVQGSGHSSATWPRAWRSAFASGLLRASSMSRGSFHAVSGPPCGAIVTLRPCDGQVASTWASHGPSSTCLQSMRKPGWSSRA